MHVQELRNSVHARHLIFLRPLKFGSLLAAAAGVLTACTEEPPPSAPVGGGGEAVVASVPLDGISRTLPDSVGPVASIVWHAGNGRVYASTNSSYLLELDATDLSLLKSKFLASGRAHEISSDGTYLYVHVDGNGHRVFKIRPSDLASVASTRDLNPTLSRVGAQMSGGHACGSETTSLNGAGSPEGFVFLEGALFVAVGGPPGKIVKINPTDMSVIGQWPLPNGIENHGLTSDGKNIFVLGVPTRGYTPDRYFKLSPSLALLGTLTFAWKGSLGGNVYLPATGSVYAGTGRVTRIDPNSFTLVGSSSFNTTSSRPLHWFAADEHWIYAMDYDSPGAVRVFDPRTLSVVFSKNTNTSRLHYGIVQNGYLWTASESMPGVVGRYNLYPPPTTPPPPPPPPPSSVTVTFAPEADTYTSQSDPSTNYGIATGIAVGGGTSRREFFIRFNVTGLPVGATVTDARLILACTNAARDPGGGGTIRQFAPTNVTWSETEPTWNSPLLGSDTSGDLFTLGPVAVGGTYTFGNLKSAVPGNGRVTFVVRSQLEDGAQYFSKQAGTASQRPILRVTYTTGP